MPVYRCPIFGSFQKLLHDRLVSLSMMGCYYFSMMFLIYICFFLLYLYHQSLRIYKWEGEFYIVFKMFLAWKLWMFCDKGSVCFFMRDLTALFYFNSKISKLIQWMYVRSRNKPKIHVTDLLVEFLNHSLHKKGTS